MRTVIVSAMSVILMMSAATGAGQQVSERFRRWDRNSDGRLSRDELPEPLRRNFSRVDTNEDGFISPEEDAAFLQRGGGLPGRRAAATLPDSVIAHRDLAYVESGHPRQRLDLLLPRERAAGKRLPVVAFVHGGGWRQGDKQGALRNVVPFVAEGDFAGVSIGYRLSGDAIWPAQIHDCKAAIRWLRANADTYGLDPDRIAVWGSSAGGHLVAMLGASTGVAAMDGNLGAHTDQSTRVSCVVDYFGPTDFLRMNATAVKGAKLDHDAADSPESLLIGGPIQDNHEKVATANPITWVTSDDPPFLIVHGTADPLVSFNQSELLRDALTAANVDVTLIPVTAAGHGGFRNPHVLATVRAFLRNHLLGESSKISGEPISNSR